MDPLFNKIREIVRGRKFILTPTPGGEENESDVTYVPDFEILLADKMSWSALSMILSKKDLKREVS